MNAVFDIDDALRRAAAYLAAASVRPTRDLMVALLRLVEEAIERGESQPALWVMEQLPQRFPVTGPDVPPVVPKIQRGSIRYAGLGRARPASRR